jgi:membrane protease YdiL (CAAX protease family)
VKSLIKRLPTFVEFLLVIAVAFGPFIAVSARSAMQPAPARAVPASDSATAATLCFELLALGVVLVFLRVREWPIRSLAPRPTLRGTVVGGSLLLWALAIYFVLYLGFAVLHHAGPEVTRLPQAAPSLITAAFIFVNPIFEETLANAYVILSLKRFGGPLTIALSTLLRLSYHLYQGWIAVPSVLAFGLVLSGFYWVRRDLWPPIVAHLLADLLFVVRWR